MYLDQFEEEVVEREGLDGRKKKVASSEKRPNNWREITREFNLNGFIGVKRSFPEFLIHESGEEISPNCLQKRLSRYNIDLKKTTPKISRGGHSPAYGMDIDNELYLEVKQRRAASLSVNDLDLRNMLVTLLAKNNMSNILFENGGKFHFGESWAQRFRKRHDLTTRVPTSKARENAAGFDLKVEKYKNILSLAINSHRVPPELVINCDETGLNFVSNAKRTIETKGTRKVRMCGVGRSKAQIR